MPEKLHNNRTRFQGQDHTADLASDEDIALLRLDGRQAVLTIDEVAYDQAGVPTILGMHRATTTAHAYFNEVR